MTAAGVEKEVTKFETRYPVVKTFRFAIAGALGFGVTEVVLTIGPPPHLREAERSSREFFLGRTPQPGCPVARDRRLRFLPHQRTDNGQRPGSCDRVEEQVSRFLKFQAVSGVGNTGIVVVQLLLLSALEVSPLLGTVVGAVVTYPIVYFISIKYVWKGHQVR